MTRKRMRIGRLRLQGDSFGRELDVELMFGTIAFAGEATTHTVLTLRFAFVALFLAPSTSTKE